MLMKRPYVPVAVLSMEVNPTLYVTLYRKRALVAQITEIELLVPLECAFQGDLNSAIDAAIRRSVAKL